MTDTRDPEPWFAIERALRDDTGGREQTALIQRLEDAARQVKRRLDAGLEPAEYQRGARIHAGLLAGVEVVNALGKQYHRRA